VRKRLSELPHLPTDLAQQRTSEKRQGNARSVAAEYSGELGVTPASDSRRSTDSHLGRTFARAYPSDGECPGALGVELEALVWPATSGGALSGNGARRSGCCCAVRAEEEGEGGRGGDRMEGVAWEPAPASRPGGLEAGRGASNAGVRPPRGRRRVERGGRRARGREGKGEAGRAARWAEREAGLAQQRLPLSPFFLNFFSPNSF
jgi:hypothetical protein